MTSENRNVNSFAHIMAFPVALAMAALLCSCFLFGLTDLLIQGTILFMPGFTVDVND